MIDYTKFKVLPKYVPSNFKRHYLLNFTTPVNTETGEVKENLNHSIAEYKNLKFKLYDSGVLIITGSLHKYFNLGFHNYNKFNKTDLDSVLNELEEVFKIKLSNCILQNIEFGLNITPPLPSTDIVKNILTHYREPFKYYSIKGSEYKQAIHSRYFVKAYDKALMYNNKPYIDSKGEKQIHNIEKEIFRFEIKYVKMLTLNRIGIRTLNDLYDKNKLRLALELLSETWDNLNIYDPTIKKENLSSYVRNVKLNQWQNKTWWTSLNKYERRDQKKAMNSVVKVHSQNIKKNIAKKLQLEIRELLCNYPPMTLKVKNTNSPLSNSSYIVSDSDIICKHFSISNLVNKNLQIAV